METTSDKAKIIYNMFHFQYAPLENRMKKDAPELWKQFKTFPYARRIMILDNLKAKGF